LVPILLLPVFRVAKVDAQIFSAGVLSIGSLTGGLFSFSIGMQKVHLISVCLKWLLIWHHKPSSFAARVETIHLWR
jgi:hypothetical protein